MSSLKQYREERVELARNIGLHAIKTLYEQNNMLGLNVLKANLNAQVKLGKTGEAFKKSKFKRKQVEKILRCSALLADYNVTLYKRCGWKWDSVEVDEFCSQIQKARGYIEDCLNFVIFDEQELNFINEQLEDISIESEVCSYQLASNVMEPEQLLLTILRCCYFIWKGYKV